MKKLVLLATIFTILCSAVFAQEKDITAEESDRALIDAFAKYSDISFRKIRKTEVYDDKGVSTTEEYLEESIKPNKRRIVEIERQGKSIDRFEIITIGEKYYCKKNEEAWVKSDTWCGEPRRVRSYGKQVGFAYTVANAKLNNQDAKVYRQYSIYQQKSGKKIFVDYSFWIGNKGFILQRETLKGVYETKEVTSRMIETSQYNPSDLKIEAPQ